MGYDSYLPLKKSGQSVIDQNLPYRFLRGQPLKHFNAVTTPVYGFSTVIKLLTLKLIVRCKVNCHE